MANIIDYLDWRGDLSLKQSPFNEVDNLVLSQMAYINFEEIVSPVESNESITIKEAAERYFALHSDEKIKDFGYLVRISVPLLKKMSQSHRFGNAKLAKYVNVVDIYEQKQFSAIHIMLEDGTIYVAYRGTDNTIIGWKENFTMTFMTPIPSQIEAVHYLEETVKDTENELRIGGHSKGGNLAVYAAIHCSPSIQSRIMQVYNNDGPGFESKITQSKEYQNMLQRIKTILPQSSIVGMLLEHEEEYSVVKSSQVGFLQHDALSWEVVGKQFIIVERVAKESQLLDVTLKAWLNKMDKEQRERFVDAMFYVFHQTNVNSFDDLSHQKWKKVTEMIKVVKHMSPENKEILTRTFSLLFEEGKRVYRESKMAAKEKEERKR
ncbi:DUF2974 domain-containing protein [Alkalihalobacillus sp. LMS39]|uniref:DUF2974 domain-containing protein n=1 Tax=Alkalihalobacillus sp. LMS39 TaxID=2924032 RepID=UPI001FB1E89B|nr:DUF2974 domain-containing protein [Alkalihalobacillus sp. LMS39]UOE94529.1 DUF2974 domain-containing protein [Alkalihalobacillus sp. LMS39]